MCLLVKLVSKTPFISLQYLAHMFLCQVCNLVHQTIFIILQLPLHSSLWGAANIPKYQIVWSNKKILRKVQSTVFIINTTNWKLMPQILICSQHKGHNKWCNHLVEAKFSNLDHQTNWRKPISANKLASLRKRFSCSIWRRLN